MDYSGGLVRGQRFSTAAVKMIEVFAFTSKLKKLMQLSKKINIHTLVYILIKHFFFVSTIVLMLTAATKD